MSKSANSNAGHESPDSTSTGLLDRVRSRDHEAWQCLVDLYGPLIYEWCRLSGVQSEDAADVLQEVFVSVAGGVGQFRRERPEDSFRGWLWTITRNKVRDHYRRLDGRAKAQGGTEAQRRLAEIPDQPPCSTSTEISPKDDNGLEHRAMELVRASVEERTWQAFWLLTVDGRPVADIAEELGMNTRTVYEAKYCVLRRLRQELQGMSD